MISPIKSMILNMPRLFVLLLLSGFLIAGTALAGQPSTAKVDSEAPAGPPPEAVFPQTNHSFDKVMEGAAIRYDFIVENHGAGALEIIKVQPD